VAIYDPYMYALDHPGMHDLAMLSDGKEYRTPRFNREIYEENRRKRFSGHDEAYLDWLAFGREAGLTYAPGADTYLKLILKVSDEPELLSKWIDYHAAIVGRHNLVVMDCASTDPEYLDLLADISKDVVVFSYKRFYDRIHNVAANRALFDVLRQNSRYLSILDADEFIFGHGDGAIGGRKVLDVLRSDELDFYAGIWFENAEPMPLLTTGFDFGGAVRFLNDDASIRTGAIAGKSVVRTSAFERASHIGHNLTVTGAVALARPASLGRIGVLHLRKLGGEISRRRVLRHLRARGNVADGGALPADTQARLAARFAAADPRLRSFVTRILDPTVIEPNPEFARALDAFDFAALLSAQRGALLRP
jgi:hypothetical protein